MPGLVVLLPPELNPAEYQLSAEKWQAEAELLEIRLNNLHHQDLKRPYRLIWKGKYKQLFHLSS
uniref:Uncharacterized protein n=1 Tax=Crocodylus porosus TaxID=8502 RepID=A0A7M4FI96_CROPO